MFWIAVPLTVPVRIGAWQMYHSVWIRLVIPDCISRTCISWILRLPRGGRLRLGGRHAMPRLGSSDREGPVLLPRHRPGLPAAGGSPQVLQPRRAHSLRRPGEPGVPPVPGEVHRLQDVLRWDPALAHQEGRNPSAVKLSVHAGGSNVPAVLFILQSLDYHGYLEGKCCQNGDAQRPARGIADLQISNLTINQLFRPYVTKC